MGRSYSQLSLEDRIEIARLSGEGSSIRQIAAALDRAPSSIARELKRNSGAQVGYKPVYADKQTRARRWTGSKLDRDDRLRDRVLSQLASGWSPEQVAGRSKREGSTPVSYETIYRFIQAQITRTNDFAWRRFLPRGKYKRGRSGHPRPSIARVPDIGKPPSWPSQNTTRTSSSCTSARAAR
jgi:transposase, IS30 family